MAITQVNISSPSNEIIYTSTVMGNTVEAIKASSAKVYAVTVDNSSNGSATYVKIWNIAAGSVVLGTTAPDEIIYAPASVITTHTFFTGSAPGKTFGTALSAAAVTAGGTAGSTSPSSSTVVSVNYV